VHAPIEILLQNNGPLLPVGGQSYKSDLTEGLSRSWNACMHENDVLFPTPRNYLPPRRSVVNHFLSYSSSIFEFPAAMGERTLGFVCDD